MADREGRPEKITVVATGVAMVATALTVPIWFDPGLGERGCDGLFPDGDCGPSDLTTALWYVTFVVGVTSMFLAIVARRRERRRGSVVGQRLARVAIWAAILGACQWGF